MKYRHRSKRYRCGIDLTDTEKRYREIFRESAIAHGVGGDCVIDKDAFAEISGVTGCFKLSSGCWIVYDTDERAQVFGAVKHESARTAYTDLAARLGFCFNLEEQEREYPQNSTILVVNELSTRS